MRKLALFSAFVSSLILGVPGTNAQDPAQLVEVDTVRVVESAQTSDVVGRIIAKRQGNVAVRIDGSIEDIPVDVGDHVQQGDVLAKIDDVLLKNHLETAKIGLELARATLKTRRAELDLARQEVARLSRLRGSAAASKADYEDAVQQQVVKEAELEEARIVIRKNEVDISIANTRLGYTSVLAPYTGIITERYQEIGDFVQRGAAMFKMTGDTHLEIEANLFTDLVNGLDTHRTITATIPETNQSIQTVVRAILPTENNRTRTRIVRFSFDQPVNGVRLTPGQSVTLRIPAGPTTSFLSVHKDAITYQQGKPTVFVVIDGKAEPRALRLGAVSGNRFEVIDGVSEGDLVINRGNERMQPGQSVQVRKTDE